VKSGAEVLCHDPSFIDPAAREKFEREQKAFALGGWP
jgi:hypothetical protein